MRRVSRKNSTAQQLVRTDTARGLSATFQVTPGRAAGQVADLHTGTRTDVRFGHNFGEIQVLGPAQRGAGDGGKAPPKSPKKKAAKPPGTTNIKAPVHKTYTVTGDTLADAAAVIEAREEAGLTEWKPKLSYKTDDQGLLTSATVTVTVTVTMPRWAGAKKLSKAAKAEWDRFYQALAAHEQGHVDLVNQHLSGLGASLIGKTEADANAAFEEAVQTLQESSDAYDVDTDHGRNRGTELDTSVQ